MHAEANAARVLEAVFLLDELDRSATEYQGLGPALQAESADALRLRLSIALACLEHNDSKLAKG